MPIKAPEKMHPALARAMDIEFIFFHATVVGRAFIARVPYVFAP